MELFWFIGCAAVGYWANQRGRSPILWGLLSMVISPLLAGDGDFVTRFARQVLDC